MKIYFVWLTQPGFCCMGNLIKNMDCYSLADLHLFGDNLQIFAYFRIFSYPKKVIAGLHFVPEKRKDNYHFFVGCNSQYLYQRT